MSPPCDTIELNSKQEESSNVEDFTPEILEQHINAIEAQGVSLGEIDRVQAGYHYVRGFLSDSMFANHPDLFRQVFVLFLNIGVGKIPVVKFVNCTAGFERRMEFTLDSVTEIPDYSVLVSITRNADFRNKDTGLKYLPPASKSSRTRK